MQIAARNGDYITPTIVGTGEHDYDRDVAYTRNLFRILTRDQKFGESNKELFATGWPPGCRAASRPPMRCSRCGRSRPRRPSPSPPASTSPRPSSHALLESIELDTPKEMDK